jgi:hypothetical protein
MVYTLPLTTVITVSNWAQHLLPSLALCYAAYYLPSSRLDASAYSSALMFFGTIGAILLSMGGSLGSSANVVGYVSGARAFAFAFACIKRSGSRTCTWYMRHMHMVRTRARAHITNHRHSCAHTAIRMLACRFTALGSSWSVRRAPDML